MAMLEVPVDAWYVWIGLVTVAAVAFGVATALPTAPPPDATAAANTVDAVAGSINGSTGEHPVAASAVKLAPHQVSLRGAGGVSHAPLAYGPVTPVGEDERLRAVLDGAPPASEFDSPAQLAEAAEQARQPPYRWQTTDRIRVRTVVWGETRVTLVGV